jgi:hypothetical protein
MQWPSSIRTLYPDDIVHLCSSYSGNSALPNHITDIAINSNTCEPFLALTGLPWLCRGKAAQNMEQRRRWWIVKKASRIAIQVFLFEIGLFKPEHRTASASCGPNRRRLLHYKSGGKKLLFHKYPVCIVKRKAGT